MTVTVAPPEELDLCYNYLDGALSDPVGGSSETVIRRIELDLAEDSTTVRLKKTLFIIAEADTEGKGLITADSLKTVSRRNVGGFSDFKITDLATKKIRYAYSGESEEKGAYFTLTLSSGVEDLSKFSVGIVNAEADRYDETPSYPAFYLNMKIFYDQAK